VLNNGTIIITDRGHIWVIYNEQININTYRYNARLYLNDIINKYFPTSVLLPTARKIFSFLFTYLIYLFI